MFWWPHWEIIKGAQIREIVKGEKALIKKVKKPIIDFADFVEEAMFYILCCFVGFDNLKYEKSYSKFYLFNKSLES